MNLQFLSLVISFLLLFPPSVHAGGRLRQILESSREIQSTHCDFEGLAFESALESVVAPLEISTGRFKLRQVGMGDFETVKKVWGNEEVAKMSGDYLSDGDIQGLLAMGQPNFSRFRRGSIVNLGIYEGDKLIGMCQLGSTAPDRPQMKGLATNYNENWAEVSYHLAPEAWGKGVATEVAKKLVETAMGIPGVVGVHGQAIVSNEGSQNVLKKAGLNEIDRFLDPSPYSTKGGSVYFALTKAQFEGK